jgi:hypothetical protein
MTEKNWLSIEIKAAEAERKRWPEWMREAALFEPRPDRQDPAAAAGRSLTLRAQSRRSTKAAKGK